MRQRGGRRDCEGGGTWRKVAAGGEARLESVTDFRCANEDLTSLPDLHAFSKLSLVDVRNNPRLRRLPLELLNLTDVAVEASGTPALSTLDWSFTNAYNTLTKERLRKYYFRRTSGVCTCKVKLGIHLAWILYCAMTHRPAI